MPKKVFWPAAFVTMGLIFIASNMGYLPLAFINFWPLILILVGLGGLLTSDRDEWIVDNAKQNLSKKRATTSAKKTAEPAKKSPEPVKKPTKLAVKATSSKLGSKKTGKK